MSAFGNYEVVHDTFDYPSHQTDLEIPAPTGKVVLGCHVQHSGFAYRVKSDGSAMIVRNDSQPYSNVTYWMTVAEMGCTS
ncbi:hypothetical protein SEA_CONCEPTII_16 [Mycobacterium phage ConceptII]|nr:hypothetical protein SEA_CONCEPTII_16 [Mycobacterium phage ConceptII]WAB09873.1 hypothetical protein PBI_ALTMAN_17 [Mycobacterium phage Altman]